MKHQEEGITSSKDICTLGGVDKTQTQNQDRTLSDRAGTRIRITDRITEKKVLKKIKSKKSNRL